MSMSVILKWSVRLTAAMLWFGVIYHFEIIGLFMEIVSEFINY